MRSDLVFNAMTHISNRFMLTKLVSKATRKLHIRNTRIQETMNDVLTRCGRENLQTAIEAPQNVVNQHSSPFVHNQSPSDTLFF